MIKVIVLLENTSSAPNMKYKHGLSLYIETDNHKILFDMGPNDFFLKNADTLGVNIADIDTAVISHGHIDHCGGLKYFLQRNTKAKIFIRPQAIEKHYVKVLGIPFYAGIDNTLISEDRFIFTGDHCIIDDEITLFSNVEKHFPLPKSDSNLFVKQNGKLTPDNFIHEQNLIVSSNNKKVLLCGCAHSGIANIVNGAKNIINDSPTAVIGGFHLYEPAARRYESDKYITDVAAVLADNESSYYTCHCTGMQACEKMKNNLGARLSYIGTGTEINI